VLGSVAQCVCRRQEQQTEENSMCVVPMHRGKLTLKYVCVHMCQGPSFSQPLSIIEECRENHDRANQETCKIVNGYMFA